MEQLSTPSGSEQKNGRSWVTPKNRKKSPGDALGSGKSQLPITRFYSPLSSSSNRSSQPYSPIGDSVKRRNSVDLPQTKKKARTQQASYFQNSPTVVLSSDESTDDVFCENQLRNSKPVSSLVPKSRLDRIKRRLYCVTSSPISSGHSSAWPRKKRLSKSVPKVNIRRPRILSDSDSEDEVPMESSKRDQPLQDAVTQSLEVSIVSRNFCTETTDIYSEANSVKTFQDHPQPSQVALAAKRLGPDTSSQAIVLSSSEDSDFELHNSKQCHSFLSQSMCGKDASRLRLLPQESSNAKFRGASFVGKPPARTEMPLEKRFSLESISDSVSSRSTGNACVKNPASARCGVSILSGRRQKGLHEPLPLHTVIKSDCEDGNSRRSNISLPVLHGNSLQPTTNETRHPKISERLLDSAVKPDHPEMTEGLTNSQSRHKAVDRYSPLVVPNEGKASSHTKKGVTSECSNSDSEDDGNTESSVILNKNGNVSSIYLHDTLPPPNTDEAESGTYKKQLDCAVESGHHCQTASLCSPNHPKAEPRFPPPGHSIYNEETIDPRMHPEVTLDLDSSLDFTCRPTTNGEPNSYPVTNRLESPSPGCSPTGNIIEPSDEEDESVMVEGQSGLQVTKNHRPSLGTIPLSELLDVTHISGSDNSDYSDIVHSDDEGSIIDGSVPESTDAIATHMKSLLIEGSNDTNDSINSIMNSVLDASADFFSDVISSLSTSVSVKKDLEYGKPSEGRSSSQESSPTRGIVSIALAVAGLQKSPELRKTVDLESRRTEVQYQVGSATDFHAVELDGDYQRTGCGAEGVGLPESNSCQPKFYDDSTPDEATEVHENVENAVSTIPQSHDSLSDAQVHSATDSCMNGTANDRGEPMDLSTRANEAPMEIRLVCGFQPPENLAKLHIIQNIEKPLYQNPNRPLLLDTIISECQNYAEHVLSREPIKKFVLQYTSLPRSSKVALHGCVLELLENPNRWLKYEESSAGSVDDLVSSGIFEYLDTNNELLTKLNHLTFSELVDILCKLGNSPSKSVETMQNTILSKFSSAYTCERVKKEVTRLINRKFVKLTEDASFCIKICLELFVLPLNLCDKLYKTVDVARFVNTLIRDLNSNRFLLLPLRTTKMVANSDRVLSDLSDICRLKSEVFGSDLNDESIYHRVNDICSSIAVLEFSAETDPSVKNSPTFGFLMTNYVHALDEQLKFLLYHNTADIELGACIYLGVLLKQNVTGSQHKVKWCRERMRYLSKLFNSSNAFEEFSNILKEPVTPVEFVVRSEFVSNSFKIKKLGLSLDQKSHLTKLLRPVLHKKTQMPLLPLNSRSNCYHVLTKKPKGKHWNFLRANIFENYKAKYPCGVEDNGALLMNAIYLTFWQAIYLNLEGAFVNKFQNCPVDWGSEEFFVKRKRFIEHLVSEMEKHGLSAVLKLINYIFEQFFSHRCVVEWQMVAPNMSKIQDLLEALGLDVFLKMSVYVLGKVNDRILGFPDVVLWNPESKTVKFLGFKKPTDPLYPHQILWLETLTGFGVDAEELIVSGSTGLEQCSQLE